MISELISDLARQLVVLNTSWLSEIRSIGYLNKFEDRTIVSDGDNEIGITDASGNSGYIRFVNDRNFTVEEITSYTSCRTASRFTYYLRLIIVAKTTTPENLSLLLSTQINSIQINSMSLSGDNVKSRSTGGGSNSINIVRGEGAEQTNSTFRTVYVDFTISFDWRKDCDQIPIIMACDNCTNIYDIGCIQHCLEVTLETNSSYTGTATLNTFFNGTVITQSFDVAIDEPIVVPMAGLNENYEYNIQLMDSDGEVITLTFGSPSQEYDCFSVKLMP